jgi:hypothetical protein
MQLTKLKPTLLLNILSLQLDINNLDPTSYSQTSKLPHWRTVTALDLDALARNNT